MLIHGWLSRLIPARQRRVRRQRRHAASPEAAIESLETRTMLSVNAVFSGGVLTVTGDANTNNIDISRNAAGRLLVNNGAVAVAGGIPTVANTSLVRVFGLAGNDRIRMIETNGALPAAIFAGGSGNDMLIGGSAADTLIGQGGNDNLQGRGGSDLIAGGGGNDTLIGGDDNDLVHGSAGNDRMIWNPGDDTDLNEGGAGVDTTIVNGGNGGEIFTATANGTRVRFDRLNPAPFAIDIGTTEKLLLNARGGNDAFSATGNLAALIQITADGGDGDDTLLGSNGSDVLKGGNGNDFVDGQQGNDVALLGAGNDTFQWDPGDGSDVVEGQTGSDRLLFNGSAASEVFDVFRNGQRVRLFRNVGNIAMDLDDIETIDLNALAGADFALVHDLTGTDLVDINLNLGVNGFDDLAADFVIVEGTQGSDIALVTGGTAGASVLGLAARVDITGAFLGDRLVVDLFADDDILDASGLTAGALRLTGDGGFGDDVLVGSALDDILLGGDGDDVLIGGPGVDVLDGGLGDNIIIQD